MTGGGRGLHSDGWDMEMTFEQRSDEMSSIGSGEELGFYSECD